MKNPTRHVLVLVLIFNFADVRCWFCKLFLSVSLFYVLSLFSLCECVIINIVSIMCFGDQRGLPLISVCVFAHLFIYNLFSLFYLFICFLPYSKQFKFISFFEAYSVKCSFSFVSFFALIIVFVSFFFC